MQTNTENTVRRAAGALSCSLRIKGFTKVLGGIVLVALLHNPIQALSAIVPPGQSVVVGWNPSADPAVVGYNLYSGVVSGAYTNEIPAGSATNATVSGLIPGTTYFFAARSYISSGVESPLSSQLLYTVPLAPSTVQFQVTPAGQYLLIVTGAVGQTYYIQATEDFHTWTVIGTATVGAGGSADFTDTNSSGFSSRFYRVQQ
jgi:hypothetical protein